MEKGTLLKPSSARISVTFYTFGRERKRMELRHSKNRIGGGETWIFDLPIVTPSGSRIVQGRGIKTGRKVGWHHSAVSLFRTAESLIFRKGARENCCSAVVKGCEI